MRKAPVTWLLLLLFYAGYSQVKPASKLGATLKHFLATEQKDQRFISNTKTGSFVSVFIEFTDQAQLVALPPTEIHIRTRTNNIATADIPIDQVERLAASPSIKRIELPLLLVKTDTIIKKVTGVDKVLGGLNPLDKSYSGSNVIMGIIDDGIDITHPDFMDATGKTRIKTLWNMDYAGTPPEGYLYGHVWAPDSIDQYVRKFQNQQIARWSMQERFGYGGHGTPVTGLAAGKNGVATNAEIISVALTAFADTLLRSDRVIDAIAFIYSKAKAQKKKCVINISLGVMDGGPHDGQTLVERAIDNFCAERNDLLICVSAGNNGNTWKHWGGFPIHKDSSYGFFRCAYKASLYVTVPKQFSSTLSISIGEAKLGDINRPNISPDSVYYQTPYINIADLVRSPMPLSFDSKLPNGNPSSTITFTASSYNDDYDELIITTDDHTSGTNGVIFDDHLYRFIFKGTGTVHAWYPFWNLHPIYFFGNNPYPDDPTYNSSDNGYTTNIPSHAFSVLSSGAYNIRSCYVNKRQNKVVYGYQPCQLTYFTSHGPTLDGRIKPDILSPGENVLTPRSRMDDFLDHEFIIDTDIQAFSGTSAASPITAGVAAMIWEKYPDFIRDSVINRIKSTAYADDYTLLNGPLPNNVSGWGKIDAFRALSGEITDYSLFCQNNVCEVTVVPTDPRVSNPYHFRFFPNPAFQFVIAEYNSETPLTLLMYNSIGQRVSEFKLPASPIVSRQIIYLNYFAPGIYFMRITGKNYSISQPLLIGR
ncbi:S8 family peptidase [Flavihumibacter solisilvae]|uniref:Peptidase S8/S53 domain-containing protein n=1 Tax=Flavihumibacter solisilvae TaxID=1349421 RepID=A0A0C1KZ39_9BACT|nr:S8 family peptidase [Flavihumibacter solisilvae]KIC92967.1 hypothetical protein OI18_19630 [Flavihumibacter solisilvae]